jgi:hypothetical protein
MAEMSRDFATMLDELISADEDASPAAARAGGVDFLAAFDELAIRKVSIGDSAAAASYGEATAEPFAAPVPPRPERIQRPRPSLSPADIRRELAIEALRDGAALDAARRRFAFANHPDRVEPELRDIAEQRMRMANMMIDEAKRLLEA